MHKRRLLKLADLLEANAKNKKGVKFDIGTWGLPSDKRKPGFFRSADEISLSCKTTACAVGLACISGAFKRQGLRYELSPRLFGSGYTLHPLHEGNIDLGACRSLFGLTRDEAEWLFTSSDYIHTEGVRAEREVAKRLRDFVAGRVSP